MNLLAMNLMYTHLLAMIFIDSFTHSCLVTVVIYTECFIGIYIYIMLGAEVCYTLS